MKMIICIALLFAVAAAAPNPEIAPDIVREGAVNETDTGSAAPCLDDPRWKDNYGTPCAQFAKNPHWCNDGLSATGPNEGCPQSCKTCPSAPTAGPCLDDPKWKDNYGTPCARFAKNPHWCNDGLSATGPNEGCPQSCKTCPSAPPVMKRSAEPGKVLIVTEGTGSNMCKRSADPSAAPC